MTNDTAFLQRHLEALIFSAVEPVSAEALRECLSEWLGADLGPEAIATALADLVAYYQEGPFAFEIVALAGGYQFLTKPDYRGSIDVLLRQKSKKHLSTSALETLAIVAYKQPVTKAHIEQIRGVSSDYALQKLLDKGLLEVRGKATTAGRPVLYGTSIRFMDYLGINDLKDLPMPKDFATEENEIGVQAEEDSAHNPTDA